MTEGAARRAIVISGRLRDGFAASVVDGLRSLGWFIETVLWPPRLPSGVNLAVSLVPQVSARLAANAVVERLRSLNGRWDLAIVIKGFLVPPSAIFRIKKHLAAPVICWNPDSPFDYQVSNHGGWIVETIRAYDAYFTYGDVVRRQLKATGATAFRLPFGWDHLRQPYRPASDADRWDQAAFIGTWTPEREWWLRKVSSGSLLVFGEGWQRCKTLEVHGPVYGEEYAEVIRRARFVINLLRPQNATSHNMKSFEILGAGGAQLAMHSPEHEELFQGLSVPTFASPEQLESVLRSDSDLRMDSTELTEWLRMQTYQARCRKLTEKLVEMEIL